MAKFTGYERRIDPLSYGDGKDSRKFRYNDIKFFEKNPEKFHGLTHYTRMISGRYSPSIDGKEVYVSEKDAINDNFVISCKINSPSICGCTSTSKLVFRNVSYRYCYSDEHLSQAAEIDRKVSELMNIYFQNK